jgi:hypothetical protein
VRQYDFEAAGIYAGQRLIFKGAVILIAPSNFLLQTICDNAIIIKK